MTSSRDRSASTWVQWIAPRSPANRRGNLQPDAGKPSPCPANQIGRGGAFFCLGDAKPIDISDRNTERWRSVQIAIVALNDRCDASRAAVLRSNIGDCLERSDPLREMDARVVIVSTASIFP